MQEKIIIIDFGSQYTQIIARRIRELKVYAEIYAYDRLPTIDANVKGVILSGSPCSVKQNNAPTLDFSLFRKKVPVLGICYGAQLMSSTFGGEVVSSAIREYGRANLTTIDLNNQLFLGFETNSQVWMSHGDTIQKLPIGANIIASTSSVPVAAYQFDNELTFGVQFHPEVFHSEHGGILLENFVYGICNCHASWTTASFIEQTILHLQQTIQKDHVILGLSGGVDSSVAAVLLHKAIGKQLHCVFVDNGLLRKNEFEQVLNQYQGMGLNVLGVKAADQFYNALKGLVDPEQKRKAIGKTFIDVFDQAAKEIDSAVWLAQGTIYPDVIESLANVGGSSVTIKSHHNVGGLPDYMKLKIIEPLRLLFKDEVRKVGLELGMNRELLQRHPFPGPGLGIRIIGEITPQKVAVLQEADAIFIDQLRKHQLYTKIWQAGAIFLPIQSVGVMGDERTYEHVIALRAVSTTDGMTADWFRMPHDILAEISNQIINQVKGINRVVYDISSKPPATIEWE